MNIRINGFHHKVKEYLVVHFVHSMLFIFLNHLRKVNFLNSSMFTFSIKSGGRKAFWKKIPDTGNGNIHIRIEVHYLYTDGTQDHCLSSASEARTLSFEKASIIACLFFF